MYQYLQYREYVQDSYTASCNMRDCTTNNCMRDCNLYDQHKEKPKTA
jgi:hypothetical protein